MTAHDEQNPAEEAQANHAAGVLIPPAVAARLRRARGRMPFGGIVHAPDFVDEVDFVTKTYALDLDDLGRYLEELADVLGRHAETYTIETARLRELEHDLAAVRRVFGAPS